MDENAVIYHKTLNLKPYCTGHDGNGLVFTVTSLGFIDYTLNFVKCLERVAKYPVILFALDIECYNILSSSLSDHPQVKVIFYPNKLNPTSYQLFGRRDFDTLMNLKLEITHQIISRGHNAFYSDGDVVFLKDPLPAIEETDPLADVLIQDDTETITDRSGRNLCMGFFYARSRPQTNRTFHPWHFIWRRWRTRLLRRSNGTIKGRYDDQVHFNQYIRNRLRVHILSPSLFPNGACWYKEQVNRSEIYVIHFNHIMGEAKRKRMISDGLWLVDRES